MAQYWLMITLSWLGTASLQYINTAGPGNENLMDPMDSSIHYAPLPYINYLNYPSPRIDLGLTQNEQNVDHNEFYKRDQDQSDLSRKRRTVDDDRQDGPGEHQWKPNLLDLDKTLYIQNDNKNNPLIIQGFTGKIEGNATDFVKKSFSPWGGKRDGINMEQMWTWKRSSGIREPSMPKRVRFSPWGGKRSGQMIYKPGMKGSKVIFSASVPELTRIVSNYSPKGERLDMAGFQFVPTLDKRHPIKILALSTQIDHLLPRDSLPFNTFMDNLPKSFKPGHPYFDVNLKKDGKRKVKFSAWGGKRSPPIIGPIWTPATQNIKDSALDSIILLRNNQGEASNVF